MSVDTPVPRFHNFKMVEKSAKERQRSLERALEDAVSRALRDNLAPLQRTADELHHAYADLVAACSSSRPSNALPALLRAQTAAAALAAGLSVLSNFVAVALNPRDQAAADDGGGTGRSAAVDEEVEEEVPAPEPVVPNEAEPVASEESDEILPEEPPVVAEAPAEVVPAAEAAVFDVGSLSTEMQELHKRANRVAKVAMQDIKLLRPKDVKLGREQKDICNRLRSDLDKARKEYDRRFRAILDHPVDYFHHWMVAILADGDREALGEYPYPSPVLRQ